MTPAPHGTLTLTLLVDVGERIDLAQAEARAQSTGRQGRRPVLRRIEAKGSIRIPVPPLILDLSEEATCPATSLPVGWSETLHVAVYDFGVLNCRRILCWPPSHTWTSLVPVIADLIHKEDSRRWGDALAASVESLLGGAIQERERSPVQEEYAILRPGAGGAGEPARARVPLHPVRPHDRRLRRRARGGAGSHRPRRRVAHRVCQCPAPRARGV